jgi:hypothetical protein
VAAPQPPPPPPPSRRPRGPALAVVASCAVPALWHGALGLAVTAEVPVQWPDIVVEPKAAHADDQVVVDDGRSGAGLACTPACPLARGPWRTPRRTGPWPTLRRR